MAARKKAKTVRRASAKKKSAPKKRTQQTRGKAAKAKAPIRKTAARKVKKPARKAAKRRAVAKRARPAAESVMMVRPGETVIIESVEEPAPGVMVVAETALSVPDADEDED